MAQRGVPPPLRLDTRRRRRPLLAPALDGRSLAPSLLVPCWRVSGYRPRMRDPDARRGCSHHLTTPARRRHRPPPRTSLGICIGKHTGHLRSLMERQPVPAACALAARLVVVGRSRMFCPPRHIPRSHRRRRLSPLWQTRGDAAHERSRKLHVRRGLLRGAAGRYGARGRYAADRVCALRTHLHGSLRGTYNTPRRCRDCHLRHRDPLRLITSHYGKRGG